MGFPIFYHNGCRRSFCRNKHCVGIPVIPAGSEAQAGIDISADVVRDGDSSKRQIDSHFCQHVHDDIDNDGHGDVGHEERRRASVGENAAGADKEAGSNGSSQGQKLQMATLETTLELLAIVGQSEVVVVIWRAGLDVDVVGLVGPGAVLFLHDRRSAVVCDSFALDCGWQRRQRRRRGSG